LKPEQFNGIGMTSQRTRDRLIQRLIEQGIRDLRVLDLIRSTPRHLFLDEALAHRAYEDSALPIGFQQTISQPYIVARMTELLFEEGRSPKRILEIGTGSGYQTAILAQMPGVEQVYSVERIQPLQDKARERLRALGIRNTFLRLADGRLGLPERAPFDAILCAAAPRDVPQELIDQLGEGGRLVMPVGEQEQQLVVVDRVPEGVERRVVAAVRFVPLLSGLVKR
jgi:protein-L-isoaspartate(D-aspartate) O-methyltransferase